MKTNHITTCDNCKTENPLYKVTCKECGHYLRSTVVNIDLWETIWNLFEHPTLTIKNVVFAEHKNFVTFLLILLSIKLYFTFTIFNSAFLGTISYLSSKHILYATSLILVLILLLQKIITIFFNAPKKRTRYKDNLALVAYSFVPTILTLVFLTPIEYGIFGEHWFDYNPSPLLIKEGTAYVLLAIEAIMFLWSLFLLVKSYYIQSGSILKSVGSTFLFLFVLVITINFIPFNLF